MEESHLSKPTNKYTIIVFIYAYQLSVIKIYSACENFVLKCNRKHENAVSCKNWRWMSLSDFKWSAGKIVSKMTYNVLSGTLNPTIPPSIPSLFINVLSWSFYMRLTGFREIGGFATLDKVNFFHDFSSNFRLLSMTLGTAVSVWIFILHGLFTMHWFHHPQTRLSVPIPQKQHWHLWNQTGPKYFIFHQTV